jgi:hypothetical protein
MFKFFLFSFKKSKLLAKIRSESQIPINSENILNTYIYDRVLGETMSKRQVYLEELFALLKTDLHTVSLLKFYNRNFDDLRKIINVLESRT